MDIQLEQTQNQILSQKMIQSVTILQMSAGELTDYVKELSMENPVVDLEETGQEDRDSERLKKLEWLAGLDEQNRIYYKQESEDSDMNDIMNIGGQEEETLKDSLLSQLIGKEFSEKEFEIFEYIAECLDSRGFFTGNAEEIAQHFGIGKAKAESYLRIMKGLEPAGVCAENLGECLERQLELVKGDTQVERRIVREYLELLGKNQLHVIAKKLEISTERVQEAKAVIKGLNPKPGCGFSSREVLRYLTPDVTVVKLADYFEVIVNDCAYPSLRISQDYMKMLKEEGCGKDVKQYISDKVRQIEQVQSCISKRNSTLLRLAKCIVEAQQEFFTYGKGHLKTYSMKEAAACIGVHESTVSRAVKEKYLQCCWGMYPLGYFFSKGFYQKEDEGTIATVHIKERLRQVIEAEDKKKPLSDQKLSDSLKQEGIDISRRTVAKYRESLGIADCRGRKEF